MAKPITIPNTFASATSAIPLSQLDQDFSTLANATNDLATYSNYVADTGAADAYIANFPANTNTASLTAGLTVQFKAANANTGASTLNVQVNGSTIGTAAIRYANGSALAAGAIAAGAMVSVMYDGTNFQLINDPAGQSGGDVTGPSSATDNAIARFDGTSGKLIQNSVVTIADTTGDMSGVGTLSAGNVTVSGTANAATLIVTGNSTLGDASGDTLTITGTTVTAPNGLNFDSNTLVIDAANNRIGVNNATPTTALDVTGTATISTNLAFTGTGNRITGDFSNATISNWAGFQSSTTNGQTNIPAIPNGTATVSSFNAFGGSDVDNSVYIGIQGRAAEARIVSTKSGTASYAPLTMYTNGSERLRIDTSGNVLVGATGVRGGVSTKMLVSSSSATNYLEVQNTSGAGASGDADVLFSSGSTGAYGLVGYSFTSNALRFFSNSSERMRINSSGNVGIGTSSPSCPLNVVSASSSLAIAINGRSSDSLGAMYFYANDGSTQYSTITASSTEFRLSSIPAAAVQTFYTNGSERMRITSGGDLIVGNTAAATGTNEGFWLRPGNSAYFSRNGGVALACNRYTSTGNIVLFDYAGSTKGSISTDGTNTAYNTSSDYRLKENIIDLPNALQTIAQLKPRQFDWKETGKTTTGFIAHELAEVLPNAVNGEKDAVDAKGKPVYQGVDTSFLVATLTAALQEAHGLIKALQARVDALESK